MIDLRQLFVLGLLTASIHWLVARSHIGEVIWSRARGWFGRLLHCPACTGWWLGLGLGIAGLRPLTLHYWWTAIVFSGLFGVVLTPVFEGTLLWGLRESAIESDDATTPLHDPPSPTPPQ